MDSPLATYIAAKLNQDKDIGTILFFLVFHYIDCAFNVFSFLLSIWSLCVPVVFF